MNVDFLELCSLYNDPHIFFFSWFIKSEELARLIRTNPKLSDMFVEKYIDTDGELSLS